MKYTIPECCLPKGKIERRHFKKVFKMVKDIMGRQYTDRVPYSYNDTLNDLGCYFLSKVNKWIKEA